MKIPDGMSPPEIRILQEFRRLEAEDMALATIREIKHPVAVDDAAVLELEKRGMVASSEDGSSFRLTESGETFLARPAEPEKDRWGKSS